MNDVLLKKAYKETTCSGIKRMLKTLHPDIDFDAPKKKSFPKLMIASKPGGDGEVVFFTESGVGTVVIDSKIITYGLGMKSTTWSMRYFADYELPKYTPKAEKPFPKTMIASKLNGMGQVVLFTAPRIGTVVIDGTKHSFSIGYSSSFWDMSVFDDYDFDKPAVEVKPFPKLMVANNGEIVFFTSNGVGTLVQKISTSSTVLPTGYKSDGGWVMSNFKDYE